MCMCPMTSDFEILFWIEKKVENREVRTDRFLTGGDEIQTEQSRKNNHLTTKWWDEHVALFLSLVLLLLETSEN